MDQEFVSQTALDQMVGNDRTQFLKAVLPYLPPQGQQILSVYAKASEFMNTVSVFSHRNSSGQMRAASVPNAQPLDMLNDIRRFCYGESRAQLDQITNIFAAVQMMQIMNDVSPKEGIADE